MGYSFVFSQQCNLTKAFRRFAMASATSGDHQALARRMLLPKGMAEIIVYFIGNGANGTATPNSAKMW